MPIEYQSKKSGYVLPQTVYMRVKYTLKDYDRMRTMREQLLHGGFGGTVHRAMRAVNEGDPTGEKGAKLAALTEELESIERVLHDMAAIYADRVIREDIQYFDALGAYMDYGLFCYMLCDPETGKQPCRQTWQNYKCMLAYHMALNLGYICAA